jgi:uncharacterized coiled-coil DUF342 family protein
MITQKEWDEDRRTKQLKGELDDANAKADEATAAVRRMRIGIEGLKKELRKLKGK